MSIYNYYLWLNGILNSHLLVQNNKFIIMKKQKQMYLSQALDIDSQWRRRKKRKEREEKNQEKDEEWDGEKKKKNLMIIKTSNFFVWSFFNLRNHKLNLLFE